MRIGLLMDRAVEAAAREKRERLHTLAEQTTVGMVAQGWDTLCQGKRNPIVAVEVGV